MFLVGISIYSEINNARKIVLNKICKQRSPFFVKTNHPEQDFYDFFTARRILYDNKSWFGIPMISWLVFLFIQINNLDFKKFISERPIVPITPAQGKDRVLVTVGNLQASICFYTFSPKSSIKYRFLGERFLVIKSAKLC